MRCRPPVQARFIPRFLGVLFTVFNNPAGSSRPGAHLTGPAELCSSARRKLKLVTWSENGKDRCRFFAMLRRVLAASSAPGRASMLPTLVTSSSVRATRARLPQVGRATAAPLRPSTTRLLSTATSSPHLGPVAPDAPAAPYGGAAAADMTEQSDGASPAQKRKPFTTRTLAAKFRRGEKITMVTAYDAPTAGLASRAGVDMLLVGDSVGMVVLGHEDTVSVTMDDMVHHCAAAARGNEGRSLLVCDLPFGSYTTPEQAVASGIRAMKEGRAHAVKLEGGRAMAPAVKALTDNGIAVVGHVGLTPQSVHAQGGYSVQGKSVAAAKALIDDAVALQEAGAIAIVLEMVPRELAAIVTRRLSVPTIGIGAGEACAGQVLVLHDMLGLFSGHVPRFVRRYADLGQDATAALATYVKDVQSASFPAEEHSFAMPPGALQALCESLGEPLSTPGTKAPDSDSCDGVSSEHVGEKGRHPLLVEGLGSVDGQLKEALPLAVTSDTKSTGPPRAARAAPAALAPDRAGENIVGNKPEANSGLSANQRTSVPVGPVAAATSARPRVAIIGGGAMGSLFASKLVAEADVRVFTSWEEHAAMVAAEGLALHTSSSLVDGLTPRIVRVPVTTARTLDDVDWRADVVLVLVKGGQTQRAAALASEIIDVDGVVVGLQNGVGPLAHLRCVLGDQRVLFGSTAQAATMMGPGCVLHAGTGETMIVPPLEVLTSAAHHVADLLDATGLPATVVPTKDIAAVAVRKLAINALINPLSALLGCTNGELVSEEHGAPRQLMTRMHGEMLNAADGLAYPLHRALGEQAASTLTQVKSWSSLVPELSAVVDVAKATGPNTSSMLADVRRGVETEIDLINGVVVEAAAAAGVPAPVNAGIVRLVKATTVL